MNNLEITVMDMILPYLSPVTFMHVIEASKYLYGRHKGEIPGRRKQSLIRFMRCGSIEDLYHAGVFRTTKLPNGKIEGKYEALHKERYRVHNYIDGEPIGTLLVYDYLRCKGERIPERITRSFRDALLRKFRDWEKIDTSKMDLVNEINIPFTVEETEYK